MTDSWKTVIGRLLGVIGIGFAFFVVFLLGKSVLLQNSPCKDSSVCSAYQTCDPKTHRCKSLPGSRCVINSDCSILAPICQPHDRYCTNFSAQAKGTSGNPPNGLQCNTGLILNVAVNLCQQNSIGAQCTIDAQCNVGVCDTQSKSCQYATARCTLDANLNPHQCAAPFQCDSGTLSCTVPGTTPGSDGSPCNSNADCSKGATCISGPPGSGFSGVCRTGDTTWLMSPIDSSAASSCISPLVGGTSWCRYDTDEFMYCETPLQCQYPYARCNTDQIYLCVPESDDPIKPTDFSYSPVGFGPQPLKGAFYTPSFPQIPAVEDNSTGGKLLTPYTGFLAPNAQFADQPGFKGGQLVTFTRLTSFAVVSMAVANDPPVQPQIPYYTAVFEDPNPILVMATILEISASPGRSGLFFSFYSQNFSIPNFPRSMYIPVGDVSFPTADAQLWNPSSVVRVDPNLVAPHFVPNPIVTPWVGVTTPGNVPSPQVSMTHCLLYAGGYYRIGFFLAHMGFRSSGYPAVSMHIPSIRDASNNVIPLSPDIFIITSWDAITTWNLSEPTIHTTVLLYGLQVGQPNPSLMALQIQFTIGQFTKLVPTITTGSIDGITMVPAFSVSLPGTLISPATHCRLSRTLQQSAEPLLLLTCFYEVATGLQYTTFAINSADDNFLFDNGCSGDFLMKGVSSLFYVTPITGAYNYGCFVIWCATSHTRSAFLIVQVNASCSLLTPSQHFTNMPVFSAVYWRRLTGDLPDTYYLYPVGGASLPYFLATDDQLTFDGIPILPSY